MAFARTALAALALLVVPALTLAAPAQSAGGMRAGVLVGLEDGDGATALALRGDLEFRAKPIAPAVGVGLVLSAGYSRFHQDVYDLESVSNVFKFIPAARFTFGRSSAIRPYADAGLGIFHWSQKVTATQYDFYGQPYRTEWTGSDTSLVFRFAGGIQFLLSSGVALGAELGFNSYLGDIDDSTTSIMGVATFRL